MRRMRRFAGRIERRLRVLPAYVLVLGGVFLGLLLTLIGGGDDGSLPRPRADDVWFPIPAGVASPVLVMKAPSGTCRKDDWETRRGPEGFLAVKVPKASQACTCLEALTVAAAHKARYPACAAQGGVSYGAL